MLSPAALFRGCIRNFSSSKRSTCDVAVIGGGHNGLVASILLARSGLDVHLYEHKNSVGGACKTEYPFPKAPGLGQSTGAYLLGVMPPELLTKLGISLPLKVRDPHYFLPTTDGRYLLYGSDEQAKRANFFKFFSQQDWYADTALNAELSALRDDLAPAWMAPPLSLEDTAEQYVRPHLQDAFISLCRGSVADYLGKFNFKSDLITAMYTVTDGVSGLTGGFHTPGSGFNFLTHNMCRLPSTGNTWAVVQGGMGTVTSALARAAIDAGVKIHTSQEVKRLIIDDGRVRGCVIASSSSCGDGNGGREREVLARRGVMANADPFRLAKLIEHSEGGVILSTKYRNQLTKWKRYGTTMKVNLALASLPTYSCLAEPIGQHRTTTHLLPDEPDALRLLNQAFDDVQRGKLPDFPSIEIYHQTAVDGSLTDEKGRISAAMFVQWVPYHIKGEDGEGELQGGWSDGAEEAYVHKLLGIWERFAPGVSSLVDDMFVLSPPKIEEHFGIMHGHIHHIDNTFCFDQRASYKHPEVDGLWSCSAGCHPAGSVIGCAGHNAAVEMLK